MINPMTNQMTTNKNIGTRITTQVMKSSCLAGDEMVNPNPHEGLLEFDPIEYLNAPRWRGVSLGLERITWLLAQLGNPQNCFPAVHVAGTNGKGSTSAFIAQILQSAGYKTGLFTSPYIREFEERIQINRHNIELDDLRKVTLEVKHVADAMAQHPTEFELMTAVAFLYFAEQSCDITVIEVGLGGRLDSTNVLSPSQVQASVITPISLDHCAVLGSTLAAIAKEKAGIIKPHVPVVSAPQQPEVQRVLEQTAKQRQAPLITANRALAGTNTCFSYGPWSNLGIGLKGRYQLLNAALALEVIHTLRATKSGIDWNIPDTAVRAGLAETRWPGRFEVISQKPLVILDGAHNEQGVASLLDSLADYYPARPVVFMVGILEDKAHAAMVEMLAARGAGFVTVPVPNPRSLSSDALTQELTQALNKQGRTNRGAQGKTVRVMCAQDIAEGVSQALSLLPPDGILCVCGSLYFLAPAQRAFEDTLK